MRWASPARWRRGSSSTSPRRLDQAPASRAGRRSRASAPPISRALASSARAPCSKARTASTTASRSTTQGDWAKLARRLRQALARRRRRLQALRLRHDDASLHRLRAAASARRSQLEDIEEVVCEAAEGTVHRLWEPLAAKQSAAQRLRRQVQPALLHRRRLRPRPRRPRSVHRGARARPAAARARRARCATRSIPAIPTPTNSPGTSRVKLKNGKTLRGAPAAHPRRRARAAVARRRRGEVPAELRLRRLADRPRRGVSELGENGVRPAGRPEVVQVLKKSISASSVASGASAISEWPETSTRHGLRASA